MKAPWLKWLPITAMASFLASGVLRWILPEPLQNLRMAERVTSCGLFLLLLWLWLAKGYGKLSNAKPVWVGWLGLVGLTMLFGPGMFWVILVEDPAAQTPPRWLNALTLTGYPLVLLWAFYRLQWMYRMMQKARMDLAELIGKKE